MKHTLKAVLPKESTENGRNYSRDKELVTRIVLVGCKRGKMRELADFRSWMARARSASVVYSSLWVSVPGDSGCTAYHIAGHGSAGGGGYHKESHAMQEALDSAGIKLYGALWPRGDQPHDPKKQVFIDGVGDSAMREALLAIGRALGYSNLLIVGG